MATKILFKQKEIQFKRFYINLVKNYLLSNSDASFMVNGEMDTANIITTPLMSMNCFRVNDILPYYSNDTYLLSIVPTFF